MIELALTQKGYALDTEHGIWCRPDYAGISYTDGDHIELGIEAIVDKTEDVSLFSSDLQPHLVDWAKTYHLSPSRANVLRPFERLLPGASVLEIGAGCGAITRYLGESGANVLALEGSPRRARICRKRTRDLDRVSVIAERFGDFVTDQSFDVITLIGVLEYANRFTPTNHPARDMLRQVAGLLKPKGTLIIAIENQLGLKYFTGALEDHVGQPMYGIENRYTQEQACTFGQVELQQILRAAGFPHSQFYAPFPDYKLPSVIITEAGYRNDEFNVSALISFTEVQDRQSPTLPLFSQFTAWPSIVKNGLGMDLANSFIVTASLERPNENSEILGYHFSTQRAREYCKQTEFRMTPATSIDVISRLIQTKGYSGPNSAEIGGTRSTYIKNAQPLTTDLYRIFTDNSGTLEQLQVFFARYREAILLLAETTLHPDAHLPPHFIDAIPQNILVEPSGKTHLIDTEWNAPFPLEFDFLLFRAIIYSYNACRLVRLHGDSGEMSLGEFTKRIYQHLKLRCDDARLDGFALQEERFQKGINPHGTFDYWRQQKNQPIRKPDIFISHRSLEHAIDAAGKTIDTLVANNARLENHIRGLETALSQTLESTSWKITAPLRKLFARK